MRMLSFLLHICHASIRLSVSACRPGYTPVKVVDKCRILLFYHVQEVIPLVFSPGFEPLRPQAQLAFKDVG